MAAPPSLQAGRTPNVVVATSVMLTFISFWRAAAIVLNDLGSSAFYVGGIAEQAIGRAAPWFILGVMLFSYAVRATGSDTTHAPQIVARGGWRCHAGTADYSRNAHAPALNGRESEVVMKNAWEYEGVRL